MKLYGLSAAAMLAACSPPSVEHAPGSDVERDRPVPTPVASTSLKQDDTPRFIGDWAAEEKLCDGGRWKFRERLLTTAGEVLCDFTGVKPVPGGYDITARCLAEGNRSDDTIALRFAQSADAMLIESKTFNAAALIRCND